MLDALDLRFHHLGVACRDLSRESEGWLAIGYRAEGETFIDPLQRVRGQFLIGPGPRLELLTPTTSDSPVTGFLDRGTKLYHQGFEAPAFEDTLAALQSRGARVTAPPAPAVAFGGRRVAFLMTPTLNLIEIIESPS